MGRPKGAKNGSYIVINCLSCKEPFKGHYTKAKFCSLKCRSAYKSDKYAINKLCIVCKNNFKLTKHKERVTCNNICRKKLLSKVFIGRKNPHSLEWRKKVSESQKGDKSHQWRGGLTLTNRLLRRSLEFKLWREAVFKRDDWTCQECFIRGGELHPDHIKPFGLFPELRFELSNGRTLCKSCHIKTPTWGVNSKYLKREDFN